MRDQVELIEKERTRRWLLVPCHHRAEVYFRQGDYEQAEALYRQVFEQAQVIGWQRMSIYAQNWLADIAVAKGHMDEAERLLQTGLPVAERTKDTRRTAFYKRSFAYLKQKRGDLEAARRWATEALDGFERLGMQPETEEMRELVEALQER